MPDPMMMLFAAPAGGGTPLAAWRLAAGAETPDALSAALTLVGPDERVSPAGFYLVALDDLTPPPDAGFGGVSDPAGQFTPDPVAALSARYHLDLAMRALQAKDAELTAVRTEAARAQARAAAAQALAAAEINRLVRRPDGEWQDGSDVIEALGLWLKAHGQDDRNPADRTWCHEDCTWPMGPHHDGCDPDPDAPAGPREVSVNLAQFHVDMIGDEDGNGGLVWLHSCGRSAGWVELGDALSEVLDAMVAHAVECPGRPACRSCGCTDDRACPGGCSWAGPDLCSQCSGPAGEPHGYDPDSHQDGRPCTLCGKGKYHPAHPQPGQVTIGPDGDGGTILSLDPAAGQIRVFPPELASRAASLAPVNRAAAPEGALRRTPGDVKPPPGLPLRERAAWTAAYALTIQLALAAPGITFHGIPGGLATDVAIELPGGSYLTTLVNPGAGYMKSPSGFATGGLGSGCAALAHALCVAALGRWAVCATCDGTGKMTLLPGEADPVPWRPEHDRLAAPPAGGHLTDAQLEEWEPPVDIGACWDCDGYGLAVHPKVYQRFKEQVISPIDAGTEWRITRARILTWLAAQDADPELAVAAIAAAIHYEAPVPGEVRP